MFSTNRKRGRATLVHLLCVGLLAACDHGDVISLDDARGDSRAYNLWTPGPTDTCSPEIHNRYATVGPDGLRYPTWHPPTDPATGCTFGHEHGRDPRGSDLYHSVGAIPFGYANAQLEISDPLNPRNEDHVGHKVEWENDIRLDIRWRPRRPDRTYVRRDREAAPGHTLEGRLYQ